MGFTFIINQEKLEKGGNNKCESTMSSMLSKRKQHIWGRGFSRAKRAQRGQGKEKNRTASHSVVRES